MWDNYIVLRVISFRSKIFVNSELTTSLIFSFDGHAKFRLFRLKNVALNQVAIISHVESDFH